MISVDETTSPFELVRGMFAEDEHKPKRRMTTAPRHSPYVFSFFELDLLRKQDDTSTRGQRIFSTGVIVTKRTLAQVVILENFHLAKMEAQAILLEVLSLLSNNNLDYA